MSDPQDHFHKPEVTEGYAIQISPVRWLAYKPKAQTNKKGRWQAMNEYGGWDNCEAPAQVYASFEQARSYPRLLQEREKLIEALENLVNMNSTDEFLYDLEESKALLSEIKQETNQDD